jgi:type II secretory pathway pseudopilin PulG
MVEVMVSVALLSIFGLAAMMVITAGTSTSADNRARVGAAGLAQRELDYAAQVITSSANGAQALMALGEEANPNIPDDPRLNTLATDGPGAYYGFLLDGQKYRVVRSVAPHDNSVESPCDTPTSTVFPAQAVTVTVTVTWDGMGASTKPHVASKIFPQKANAASGLEPGDAQLVVLVTGSAKDSPSGPRPGVKVEVTGANVKTPSAVTNSAGCAVILVTPPADGADYAVKLGGYTGSEVFVYTDGKPDPVQTVGVEPGKSVPVSFPEYSQAASLTVRFIGLPESVAIVRLAAEGESGRHYDEHVSGGQVVFGPVAPGSYLIEVGAHPPWPVTLEPGKPGWEEVTW